MSQFTFRVLLLLLAVDLTEALAVDGNNGVGEARPSYSAAISLWNEMYIDLLQLRLQSLSLCDKCRCLRHG